MRAKDYLERTIRLNRKINSLLKDKEMWLQMAYNISKDTTQPHYNPNRSTAATYEKCIAYADELESRICAEIDRLADMKAEVMSKILQIGRVDCQLILQMRYINFRTWEDIATELNYSQSWLFKKHALALRLFEKTLKEDS